MSVIPDCAIAHLSVLSVGDGDMKFSFDGTNPQDAARAERVIQDMLKRGYVIFVEVKGKLVRCKSFDSKKCEYVIADGAMSDPVPADREEPTAELKRGRGRPRGVCATTHKATAVAPTAGG